MHVGMYVMEVPVLAQCVWRADTQLRCVSSVMSNLTHLRHSLSLNLSLVILVNMIDKQGPQIFMTYRTYLQCWRYRHTPPRWPLSMGVGHLNSGLSTQQSFHPLSSHCHQCWPFSLVSMSWQSRLHAGMIFSKTDYRQIIFYEKIASTTSVGECVHGVWMHAT